MIALISKKASAAGIAALACASAVALPGVASAQSYGYDYPPAYGYGNNRYSQGTYYDPCARDQRQRATTGGLLGAAIGAVAGSQLAARGRRTEGSALGGVLGAAIGAGVGNSSAACDSRYRRDANYGYQGTYVPPAYGYDNRGYDDGRRYDDRRDGYDYYRDYPQTIDPGFSPQTNSYQGYGDECRLAESNIRLPDGRMETRYVRSCRDQSGRYRVVD
ncbi:glycine zipper 2TM domain-containing protein [Brevundimonas diminuta]|uniref:glycine zipper 2TM domain-containing protein n=1 Tax=Brevundimonas TaxID=41275 RepID=UPI0019033A10|nr:MULTISPECIES: glycine zipper 2TM domain-containing protein [Brevundimonas]MBK1969453.1 glycine zipper 2TM domain-containing protein [Brevundimonas diminuta]MBK1975234.1 glycine zipper 2TM domain-containing protein [Brevundimonas diminuta]MDA0742355.1 glycine zipper 2TM domain-containing protein [Pseudomonadota bacterium]